MKLDFLSINNSGFCSLRNKSTNWSVYKYRFVNDFYHSSSLTSQDEVNTDSSAVDNDGLREHNGFRGEPWKNC